MFLASRRHVLPKLRRENAVDGDGGRNHRFMCHFSLYKSLYSVHSKYYSVVRKLLQINQKHPFSNVKGQRPNWP